MLYINTTSTSIFFDRFPSKPQRARLSLDSSTSSSVIVCAVITIDRKRCQQFRQFSLFLCNIEGLFENGPKNNERTACVRG